MVKTKVAYVCENCGQESVKWIGKCPACGEWNTFREVRIAQNEKEKGYSFALSTVFGEGVQGGNKSLKLSEIDAKSTPRIDTYDAELNRVLGGGLVKGSVVLLGGEPGIGKSTLTLQMATNIPNRNILYVSGEESAQQIKMRGDRILKKSENVCNVLCETSMENILSQIEIVKPEILIVDSIQTLCTESVDSGPGSLTQVRECATILLRYAKASGVPVILIGHINKEGFLAGPKILEHMVDTVIQFEGDMQHLFRMLRCTKNRFGSTSELGIYEMTQEGLKQVSNPSKMLLSDSEENLSGIAVCATIEGARPFLVETQALVATAAYGTPQRSATGFDRGRLNMLLAVLERRAGFKLAQKDVFINMAGGLRITDTATDLSIIAAVLSSNADLSIEKGWVIAGEIGLSGEVRPVGRIEQRILEAEKLGFKHFLLPKQNANTLYNKKNLNIKLHPVGRIEDAIRELFG